MTLAFIGHDGITDRLNLKTELRMLRRDPLDSFLSRINDEGGIVLHHETGRYIQALSFYILSAERCLRNISVGTRYHRQVKRYLSGHQRLSVRKLNLSREFRARVPFFRVDLFNLIFHSRVLLDRAIALSRYIFAGPQLPSFTSFSDHKKFFEKNWHTFSPQHRAYAEYFKDKTEWFKMPLKAVRDKFGVHSGPAHFQFVIYPSGHDMGLFFALDARKPWAEYPEVRSVSVSARRLMRNVGQFLDWYNEYLTKALQKTAPLGITRSK